MADNDFRSYRSREPATPNRAQGDARDRGYGTQTPARGPLDDPLAELARLIGKREPANNPGRSARHHPSPPLTDASPTQDWVDDRYAGTPDQRQYADQSRYDQGQYEQSQYEQSQYDERYRQRSYDDRSNDDRPYDQRRHDDHRFGDQYDAPRLADAPPPYRAAPPSYDGGYQEPDPYAAPASRYADQPRYTDEQEHNAAPAFLPAREEHRDDRYAYPPEQLGDPDEESYTLEDYENEPPRKRRPGLLAVAAVLGLAVLGTAGAFAYRTMFGGSVLPSLPPIIKADNGPTKIVPAGNTQSNSSARADAGGSSEKLVSREEKPLDVPAPVNTPRVVSTVPIYPDPNSGLRASMMPGNPGMAQGIPGAAPPGLVASATGGSPALGPTAAGSVNGVPAAPPPMVTAPAAAPAASDQSAAGQAMPAPGTKKIRTVAIHADPSADANPAPQAPAARPAAPRTVASPAPQGGSNAPLSIVPSQGGSGTAPAPARTRAAMAHPADAEPVASAGAAGGYAVQVSSQKSEDEAQSAFSALQAKFPNQLGGRTPIIRRADLGAKGIYYRTLVGPFATMEQAASMCSSLKAAGGNCLVQKN